MKKEEFLHLNENVLHAVRIEQPNADARTVRKRTNKLLGYDDKEYGVGIAVTYSVLDRLEKKGLIRSETRNTRYKQQKVESHYFYTTDKGKKKDAEYQPTDSQGISSASEIPVFVPK